MAGVCLCLLAVVCCLLFVIVVAAAIAVDMLQWVVFVYYLHSVDVCV